MQQLNISEWFFANHQFKGENILPEGLHVDTMWQSLSMMPLDEDFIIANIDNLDLPLLCINDRLTKNVILNTLSQIVSLMIQDPEIIEDVMSYITNMTDDEELFSARERIKIAHAFIVILNNEWKYVLGSRADEPAEAFAGSVNAMKVIARWIGELYIDEIIVMENLTMEYIFPGLRTLFMMANINFDLSTINWSKIRESEINRVLEEYPFLLSPSNPYIIVSHVTEFIRLAAENQEQLIRDVEEDEE